MPRTPGSARCRRRLSSPRAARSCPRGKFTVRIALAAVTLSFMAWGQSKQAPEPTPRWPDGKVNLGSVPGKKGYWEVRPGLGGFPRANDVPFQPWAKAVYEYRTATFSQDSPLVDCKAAPGPAFLK